MEDTDTYFEKLFTKVEEERNTSTCFTTEQYELVKTMCQMFFLYGALAIKKGEI